MLARLRTSLTVLAAAVFCSGAAPQEVVAVFAVELSGVKLGPDAQRTLDEYLHNKVAAQGRFSVVPRAEVAKRLRRAKAESYKACYDEACQIEIGKELAAQKTVSTKVLRIGDACAVSIVVYDLRSAASTSAAEATGGCGITGLVRSVEKAVMQLGPKTPQSVARAGESDPKRCPLPGTLRVGEPPPKGRSWYCVDDENRRHGVAVQHHANGEVAARIAYAEGVEHGEYERFHENGQLAERGQSKRGKRVGTWTQWSRRGTKQDEGPYVAGVKHGEWTSYHGTRGYKYKVAHYAKNMKNGPSATYADDGKLRYEGQHVDGERSGTWRFYRDGRLTSERTYVRGVEEGTTKFFDKDGKLRNTQVYRAGKKHGPYTALRTGRDGATQVRVAGRYEDNRKQGVWKSYDEDGTVRREERYENGKRVSDERKARASSPPPPAPALGSSGATVVGVFGSGGSGVGTDLSRLGTPQRGLVLSTRQASGGLDRATVQSGAQRARHDLERCFEGEKKRRALDVDLRVAASGRVRRAQVRSEKKRLGSCVTEVLRATRFDPRPKATRAKLRLEFAPPR